jgi:hypothetical protein
MNLDSANTRTPGWFEHRTTAAKNIINNMTAVEMKRLRDEAEDMAGNGLPEAVKRK